jgi:hypothetical protein
MIAATITSGRPCQFQIHQEQRTKRLRRRAGRCGCKSTPIACSRPFQGMPTASQTRCRSQRGQQFQQRPLLSLGRARRASPRPGKAVRHDRRSTGCRRRDHGERSWRSDVSSSGLAGQYAGVSGHRVLRRRQVVQVAGGELPGLDRPQRRLLRPAAVEHIEAAGVKAAAAGRLARARQSPLRIIRWDLN